VHRGVVIVDRLRILPRPLLARGRRGRVRANAICMTKSNRDTALERSGGTGDFCVQGPCKRTNNVPVVPASTRQDATSESRAESASAICRTPPRVHAAVYTNVHLAMALFIDYSSLHLSSGASRLSALAALSALYVSSVALEGRIHLHLSR